MSTRGSAVDAGRPAASSGRRRAFKVIAWVLAISAIAFGLFTAVFGVISEAQRIHAYHNVMVATLLVVLSAPPALAAARDPERSGPPLVHMAVLAVAGVVTMALSLRLDVFTLPFVVLVPVLLMIRPGRTLLPEARPGIVSIGLVVLGAVPLVAYALGQAELQRIDATSEHAEFNHWVETSFTAGAILLLGLVAAIRPAAFRLTAWCAGGALAILGVASLLLPGFASAMDTPWAWAALAGGAAFITASEVERRRSTKAVA
ncbi:MAG TPA: hypothetical protein VHH92_04950 [Actinomycetota bacterium]|nr:hypothetical protein [Actinomycetota bacterium]